MKAKLSVLVAALFLVSAVALLAEKDRPHEGKVIRIDQDAKMLVVQGEKGDQWSLYWTETTKLKDGLTFADLKVGDSVHFDYMEKEGKMFLSELHRTGKA